MALLKKLNLKTKPMLKIAGLVVLGLVVIYFAFMLFGTFFATLPLMHKSPVSMGFTNYAPSDVSSGGVSDLALPQSLGYDGKSVGLSERNIASSATSVSYDNSTSAPANAQQYEATDYDVSYSTAHYKNTCAAIVGLKSRENVVFESSGEYNNYCEYVFKVKREQASDILDFLKGLKPKELATRTYTIQDQVQDFTSQISILQDKLASIDDTLGKATAAYDEVSTLATKEKDVDSLAGVINSKINTIQQLTQERIDINSQLDLIQRTKADQLDKVDYTYFNVTVSDNSWFVWQDIKDSWNSAIKYSISNVNQMLQNLSVNLVVFLFTIAQYLVYGLILLIVAKYGWKLVKNIWQQ